MFCSTIEEEEEILSAHIASSLFVLIISISIVVVVVVVTHTQMRLKHLLFKSLY